MINIIKEILFWIATLSGSICIILLFICLSYRVFCIFLDHMQNANVLRKCLMIYIKRNNPCIKLEIDQIDISKNRINKNKEDKQ